MGAHYAQEYNNCKAYWRLRRRLLGREFDDVGICIISLARYTLLKLKEKNAWHFVTATLAFTLRSLGHLVLSYLLITW